MQSANCNDGKRMFNPIESDDEDDDSGEIIDISGQIITPIVSHGTMLLRDQDIPGLAPDQYILDQMQNQQDENAAPPPPPRVALDQLREGTSKEVYPCVVCLDNVNVGDEIAWGNLCKHGVHTDCMIEWTMHGTAHQLCPTCRTPLLE